MNDMSSEKSTVLIASIAAIAFIVGGFQYAAVSAQGTGVSVTIVPNASTLASKAFSPDVANAKVGDTVTWTNKDTVMHTVTSGSGSSDPAKGKEFDSGLSGPTALTTTGKTFSHKFAAAGQFPYFCQVHPTMVGKVIVA
jgi:plastocyanin